MDIILEFFFKLFKRKVSLRKVGLYITDLLTQLEGLQFTIKASDLKDKLSQPQKISEELDETINNIDRILFEIETSSEKNYLYEQKAEKLIADFQKMKRRTKKAYIDLGENCSIPEQISDQKLLDLLKQVDDTLNQVPLSWQSKQTFKETDDSPPKVQCEPALMSK